MPVRKALFSSRAGKHRLGPSLAQCRRWNLHRANAQTKDYVGQSPIARVSNFRKCRKSKEAKRRCCTPSVTGTKGLEELLGKGLGVQGLEDESGSPKNQGNRRKLDGRCGVRVWVPSSAVYPQSKSSESSNFPVWQAQKPEAIRKAIESQSWHFASGS